MFSTISQFVPAASLYHAKQEIPFGIEENTSDGTCLVIKSQFSAPEERSVSVDDVRCRIMSDLTLVPGIGKIRAAEFQRKHIRSIPELRHTRYWAVAEKIAETIESGTVKEILRLFTELHRTSDPLLLGLAASLPQFYFDIETLGMAHAPIILLGCGEKSETIITVTQYLIRDIEEELPALLLAARHFKKDTAVVTYNGRCFDIPYLNNRLSYYGEREVRCGMHFDLLHPTRKLLRGSLSDCRLETVETVVPALKRGAEVPGYLVPIYYQRYLQHKDLSILTPVVEHNKLDAANLSYLLNYEINRCYGGAHGY